MGSDRIIYIRTDGNSKIASGHLMRCFSIAMSCLSLGMKVCFLVSDEESFHILNSIREFNFPEYHSETEIPDCNVIENRFSIIQLKTATFDHLMQELPEIISFLNAQRNAFMPGADISRLTEEKVPSFYEADTTFPNAVYLIDSYYITKEYLSALKPLVKLAYLDDLMLFDYSVDLLINYDVIPKAAMTTYQSAYQNAGQLLLGASYTPLRNQFQNRQAMIQEQVSNILITTGASDPYHFCISLIEKIKNATLLNDVFSKRLVLHMVVGTYNTDREVLFQIAKKTPYLQLHENVSDMASLMLECDLAVSAAGTTLYELCALGIPTVSFAMADNQLSSAKAFEEAGVIPWAGDMRNSPDTVIQYILDFIISFLPATKSRKNHKQDNSCYDSFRKRKTIHDSMHSLVDGKGAMRIAMVLNEL